MRRHNTRPVSLPETLAAADYEQLQLLAGDGALAVLVVHDSRLGPAFGGIRCRRYADLAAAIDDALQLARAMTMKCAIAGLPAGGAKTVILDRDGLDRAAAYRLVGRHVEAMRGRYYTGPDLGTGADDLRVVAAQTRFCASPDAGGPGDLAASTARGVLAALRATAAAIGRELAGLHVAVQGLGAVGLPLARALAAAGARLTVADLDPDRGRQAAAFGAEVVDAAAVLEVDCDLLAPCAAGGVLDLDRARRLAAAAVCGAANNVCADADAEALLHARGVVVAPDFVANAGALVHGACFHLDGAPPPPSRIDRLGDVTAEILAEAAARRLPPGVVARERARSLLQQRPPVPWFPQASPLPNATLPNATLPHARLPNAGPTPTAAPLPKPDPMPKPSP